MKPTWLWLPILGCVLCACAPSTPTATPTMPISAIAIASPTPLSGAQAAATQAPFDADPIQATWRLGLSVMSETFFRKSSLDATASLDSHKPCGT